MTSQDRPGRGRSVDLAVLRGEVNRLRRQLEAHEREHQTTAELVEHQAAERAKQRRTTRRYYLGLGATVVGSNLATIAVLVTRGKA